MEVFKISHVFQPKIIVSACRKYEINNNLIFSASQNHNFNLRGQLHIRKLGDLCDLKIRKTYFSSETSIIYTFTPPNPDPYQVLENPQSTW